MTWIFLRSQTCFKITMKKIEEVGFDDSNDTKEMLLRLTFLGKLNYKVSSVDVIVQLTVMHSALTSVQ